MSRCVSVDYSNLCDCMSKCDFICLAGSILRFFTLKLVMPSGLPPGPPPMIPPIMPPGMLLPPGMMPPGMPPNMPPMPPGKLEK